MKVSNRACIRNLSLKGLRAARTRNLIAVLAIALTTVMFTSLFTIAASINHSFQQENFRMAGGDMHASIKNITWEQAEQLRADPLVTEGGARLFLGMPEEEPFNKSHVEVSYMEPQLASHYFCVPVEGSLPREGTDEAATDTRVLGLLGVEPKVGEQFTVTYNLGVGTGNPKQVTQTFTLSGWWEYDEAVTASNILLPQSRAEEALEGYQNQGRYDMTGRWRLDVMFASSLHIESDLTELLENHGYQDTDPQADNYIDGGVNWGYTAAQMGAQADPLTVIAISALLLLIIFTGYLIIYNVFQISVTNDIQFYGLLKTIGTTGRQIKSIIRRQALLLSLVGIPIGLALGFLVGNKLTPVIMEQLTYKNAFVSFSPLIFIGAALFALFTVLLSCRKPGRVAARVSPVEAVRYTDVSARPRRAKTGKGKGSSLLSMAWANLGRSRIKTLLVVLSLSLAVVLTNVTALFAGGFDMDKYLQSKVVSDFIFGCAGYFQSEGIEEPVTEDLIADIDAQGGIAQSGRIYGQTSWLQQFVTEQHFRDSEGKWYPPEVLEDMIETADKNDEGLIANRVQVYGMEEFPLSLVNVVAGDLSKLSDPDRNYIAAVYTMDDYNNVEPDSNWMNVGDQVTLRYGDELEYYDPTTGQVIPSEQADSYQGSLQVRATTYHDVTYEVAACVTVPSNEGYRFYGADQFILDADHFQRETGTSDVMTYLFNMESDEADAQMRDFLEEYTTTVQTAYDYECRQDYVSEFEGMRSMFLTLGGALSFIVGLVGVLNFVNAVLTGIITRKREFAVLQAIGMTGRQLKTMLMLEGLLYTLLSIIFSLLLSLILSPVLGGAVEQMFWFFSYRFTVWPVLLIAPVFVLLGLLIPLLTYRVIARHTIVERLRDGE